MTLVSTNPKTVSLVRVEARKVTVITLTAIEQVNMTVPVKSVHVVFVFNVSEVGRVITR